jgi:hypothetical protein
MSPIQNTDVLAVTRPTVGTFKTTIGALKSFVATAPQVQTDWNADSSTLAGILNRPGFATSTPPTAGLLPGPDKVWIDAQRSAGPFVRLSGDTMSGGLNIWNSQYRFLSDSALFGCGLVVAAIGDQNGVQCKPNAIGIASIALANAAGTEWWGACTASGNALYRVIAPAQIDVRAGEVNTGSSIVLRAGGTASWITAFVRGEAGVANVLASGAWNQFSDKRGKRDVCNCGYGLAQVLALRPVNFFYKHLGVAGEEQIGFVAQEVQEVIPEAVHPMAEGDDTLGLSASTLIPVLVKAVQELTARIAVLEGAS